MGGWSRPRPGRFIPGKDLVLIVQEDGWSPGPVCRGVCMYVYIYIYICMYVYIVSSWSLYRQLVAGIWWRRLAFHHRSVHVKFCGGKGETAAGFSSTNSVLPSQYDSTNAPYSSLSTLYLRVVFPKRANEPGNLSKKTTLFWSLV